MLIERPLSEHSPCWFDGSYCVRTGGRLPLASQLRFLTLLLRSPKAAKAGNRVTRKAGNGAFRNLRIGSSAMTPASAPQRSRRPNFM